MSVTRPKLMKRVADIIRMRKVLHPKDFAVEAELATTKWFAYSFMSPVEATEEFARVYTSRLQWYVRRHVDRDQAEKVMGVRPGIPDERMQQFTQLWRARQEADRFGVPYNLLFDFAFDFAGRRRRKRNPLPHQVFPTSASHIAWWEMFQIDLDEKVEQEMRRLEIPQFRLEHDRGIAVQQLFRGWIKDHLVESVRNPVDHIGWIAASQRYLSVDDCISTLPHDGVQIRERISSEIGAGRFESATPVKLDDDDFLIGCFGISEAINAPGADCSSCPLRSLCRSAADMADCATKKRTGSISPVAEADLKRKRGNVAAHRARKKLVGAPLTTPGYP